METMDTKGRILETAFKLFLKKGFDNVSVTEIKQESNITTGGFYHHFDSKEALLIEVIDKYIFKFFNRTIERVKTCNGTPREKLKTIISQIIIGYDSTTNQVTQLCENCEVIDYRNLHMLYLGSIQNYDILAERYTEFHLSLMEFIEDIINEGKAQGEIRKDLDSHELSIFVQSVIDGTFLMWIAVPQLPLEKTMQSNIDQVWDHMNHMNRVPPINNIKTGKC